VPRAGSHALLTRPPLDARPKPRTPFDLHVLSAPPAFVLSQDQTLSFIQAQRHHEPDATSQNATGPDRSAPMAPASGAPSKADMVQENPRPTPPDTSAELARARAPRDPPPQDAWTATPAAAHASLPLSTLSKSTAGGARAVRVALPRRREGLYSRCRGAPQELFGAIFMS
jgi:hypothetical protein